MTLKPEKEDGTVKKTKEKSEQNYTPSPLPKEPETTQSFVPSSNFLKSLRQGTPHVPSSTEETQSKAFTKLTAAEEQENASSEGVTHKQLPSPSLKNEQIPEFSSLTKPPTRTPMKNPPIKVGTRIIIKPIKTVTTIPGNPKPVIAPIETGPRLFEDLPPEKRSPVPAAPDASILSAKSGKNKDKFEMRLPIQIQVEKPRIKENEPNQTLEVPKEKAVASMPSFDWKAIRAQSDMLWNYIEQLLNWIQDMAAKSEQIEREVFIERVNSIRLKIEQYFGITFPPLEVENLESLDILRIAMEYMRYLEENFNPNYYFCPSCNHIVAFYYPVPILPCPTCGSRLEMTSPERES